MIASPAPLAGLFEDMEREDNGRGPEPDETEGQFLRVVMPYAAHGASIDLLPLAPHGSGGQQCDTCGGWFGVTFWTCPACAAYAVWQQPARMEDERPPLPMRPTPHERDGRDHPPAPVRPHPQAAHPTAPR
ncbi:hypothetical protein ABIE67_009434 [Streptomyces sp. V4I8]|uniref:hypothetical protein n=1 Tax=Streptomyces sp. V4I8 TaxID=3156469 RepID=UPI003515A8B8